MTTTATIGRLSGLLMKVILLVVGFSLLMTSGANAITTKMFIHFDDIKGDSIDKNHRDWSDIMAVNWKISIASGSGGGGGGAGKATFGDVVWNQVMDSSFPILFESTATGKHIKDAVVDFTTSNLTYFKMEFTDIMFTSLDMEAIPGNITFTGSFNYSTIKMTYTPLIKGKPTGVPISAEFDVTQNQVTAAELGVLYAMGIAGPMEFNPGENQFSASELGSIYALGVPEATGFPTPIPSSLWLFGSVIISLAGLRRKFHK